MARMRLRIRRQQAVLFLCVALAPGAASCTGDTASVDGGGTPDDAAHDAGADIHFDALSDGMRVDSGGGEFQFRAMALTSLEDLVAHTSEPDGDWNNTQMGDTPGLAPRVLLEYGGALNRFELVQLAIKTADWYMAHAQDVIPKLLSGSEISELDRNKALGGAPSLIDAYRYTGKSEYRDYLSSMLLVLGGLIQADPTQIENGGMFSFYGPLFTGGAIIAINAELAQALREREGAGNALAKEHANQALTLLALLEKYWRVGGYYSIKPKGPIDAGDNANMLMAIATLFRATSEPQHLDRVQALINAMEALWDDKQGAYTITPTSSYIGLAENNVMLYGQLLVHSTASDPAILDRVKRFYAFVESTLYRQLPSAQNDAGTNLGGYSVMLHDNLGSGGEWYWCSGCNFLALHNIYALNLALGNLL
jgi:hypothetical protein